MAVNTNEIRVAVLLSRSRGGFARCVASEMGRGGAPLLNNDGNVNKTALADDLSEVERLTATWALEKNGCAREAAPAPQEGTAVCAAVAK